MKTHLRSFRIGAVRYNHFMELDTDEVTLSVTDGAVDGKPILKFDVHGVVWDDKNVKLGSFHTLGEKENEWVFYEDVSKREGLLTFRGIDWLRNPESLIDAEVEFSKLYLANKDVKGFALKSPLGDLFRQGGDVRIFSKYWLADEMRHIPLSGRSNYSIVPLFEEGGNYSVVCGRCKGKIHVNNYVDRGNDKCCMTKGLCQALTIPGDSNVKT